MILEELIDIKEVATLSKMSVSTLRKMCLKKRQKTKYEVTISLAAT
jgi:hypothetical protein